MRKGEMRQVETALAKGQVQGVGRKPCRKTCRNFLAHLPFRIDVKCSQRLLSLSFAVCCCRPTAWNNAQLGGVAWGLARLLRLPALFKAKFLQTVCDLNIERQLNYSSLTLQQFDGIV